MKREKKKNCNFYCFNKSLFCSRAKIVDAIVALNMKSRPRQMVINMKYKWQLRRLHASIK